MRAKYLLPIDVVTKEQLEKAGIHTVPDVELYEIRVPDKENQILDDNGNPTGKTIESLYWRVTE